MKIKLAFFLLLSVLISIAFLLPGCGKSGTSHSGMTVSDNSKKQKFHCPMHPTYITDKPGDCPICGMKLVPIKDEAAGPAKTASSASSANVKIGQYFCPMHPEVVSDKPGSCPKCGMKLELKSSDMQADKDSGRVSVTLSPEKKQMIGLRTSKVEKKNLSMTVRATALVEHDETRLAKIAPRFNGWIRSLKVNFTGAPVEKGQPLFVAYSPELLVSEREYLLSLKNYESLKDSTDEEQKTSAKSLLESARKKLYLLEVSDEEIQNLEKSRTPSDELLFRAPFAGHVIGKTAVEGKAFMSGETLFEIADLTHLWLRVAVFEYEMPLISIGQDALVTFPYLGGKNYPSKVTFIYPHIDALTRRGEIRLELDNPGHLLRPDMWANVEIVVPLGEKLVLPSSAVIDTGKRFVAFVENGDGRLEPRNLKIGVKTDDYYEVLDGVKEGENVVTRALFLIDSESQLKAAVSAMGGHEGHNENTGNNAQHPDK